MEQLESLINTLKALNEKQAASVVLQAFGRHAARFEEFDLLARLAYEVKKYNIAVPFAEKAVAMAPWKSSLDCKLNLANVYSHANYPDKAIELFDQLDQTDPDVKLKKAYALFLVGRRDDAEALLRSELANPATDEKTRNSINFNLGTDELYRDNFHEGLYRFLIHGRRMSLWQKPKLPYTEWDGTPQIGKHLIIRAEAGIGDEFINIRFMKHVHERGMIPVWYTDRKELRDMFRRLGHLAASSKEDLQFLTGDVYWCHSMDLPVIMNLEYKDLWSGPYLFPSNPPPKPSKWQKIGLRWQGNPDYDDDLHRSVPFVDLYNTANPHGILFSLQRDAGEDDCKGYNVATMNLSTFEDTLNSINELDIVITSCTSVAHAAAAMGKRTFIFVSLSSYYVWCHSAKQSPWYGENVTLLRQTKPRSWAEPLAELKEHLDAL